MAKTNMLFKKARLIWEEKIHTSLPVDCVEPKISFDRGITWMSLLNKVVNLRLTGKSSGSSIKNLKSNFKQLDVSFSFTPYIIPEIVDHELIENLDEGLDPGTYYFTASCLTLESPGQETVILNNYGIGPNINCHSKLYKVVITVKSKVNLFINYPNFTKGICIYYGKSETTSVNLSLYCITNLTQVLLENTGIGLEPIKLKNIFPFPKKGIIKIENEYIRYNDCVWNVDHWELIVIERGVDNSQVVSHIIDNIDFNLPIYLALYEGGNYGEIPLKLHPKPKIEEDVMQYLNFNNAKVEDLTKNYQPYAIGSVNYAPMWEGFGNSLQLNGSGFIDTECELPKSEGGIHLYMMITNINSLDDDPLIFGDSNGLWLKLSKFNLKPYVGYKNTIIMSYENYRNISLHENELHRIGLSWKVNPLYNKMSFFLSVNGFNLMYEDTQIKFDDFIPGTPFIGGDYNYDNSKQINNFIGFIDEWRIYNKYLTMEDYNDIHNYNNSRPNIYCGEISIDNTFFNYNNTSNCTLTDYDPLIYLSYNDVNINDNSFGLNLGVYYDDWLIQSYTSDGIIPENTNLTYPLDAKSIQIRFDMKGDNTGFLTPYIKNIALIISEGSISGGI